MYTIDYIRELVAIFWTAYKNEPSVIPSESGRGTEQVLCGREA